MTYRRLLVAVALAICTSFLTVQFSALHNQWMLFSVKAIEAPQSPGLRQYPIVKAIEPKQSPGLWQSPIVKAIEPKQSPGLPPQKAHPLPPTLAQWQDATGQGDYFSQVKPTNLGYLVWSDFPVKVYVERPVETAGTSASARRFGEWVEAVLQVVQEWGVYLPLVVVEQRETADITILRSRPPLRFTANRDSPGLQMPRARSAETRYEFYIRQTAPAPSILSHRITILLSPDLSSAYIKAAGRHELGHALGIWGHSPLETDVMYFSQVRNPPPISHRDINTLKQVYQQPTRLGWGVYSSVSE